MSTFLTFGTETNVHTYTPVIVGDLYTIYKYIWVMRLAIDFS